MNFKDKENPLVDILMPVYNEEKYLPYVINSLKHQKFINRIIVLNDHSTDKSKEICLKYGLEVYDVPKKIHERDTELSENLNFGLNKVTAPYVMKLDGDVQLPKKYIDKIINFFESKKKSNIYSAGGTQIFIKPLWANINLFLFNTYPLGGARIYRTNILKKIGGWCSKKFFMIRSRPNIKIRGIEDAETDNYAKNYNYFAKYFPNLKVLHLEPHPLTFEFHSYSGIYCRLITSILTLNLNQLNNSIQALNYYILKRKNMFKKLKLSISKFFKELIRRILNNEELAFKLKKLLE